MWQGELSDKVPGDKVQLAKEKTKKKGFMGTLVDFALGHDGCDTVIARRREKDDCTRTVFLSLVPRGVTLD